VFLMKVKGLRTGRMLIRLQQNSILQLYNDGKCLLVRTEAVVEKEPPIILWEIENIVKELKNKKAAGEDGVIN